jgi:membrane-bound lytic murein transglycosylase MltF
MIGTTTTAYINGVFSKNQTAPHTLAKNQQAQFSHWRRPQIADLVYAGCQAFSQFSRARRTDQAATVRENPMKLTRYRLVALLALLLPLLFFSSQHWRASTLAGDNNQPPTNLELPPIALDAQEEAEVERLLLPMPKARTGDFDALQKHRVVRILVPYSKTFFRVDRGRQQGISYELGKALESWLDKHKPNAHKSLKWRVVFIPVARNQLLPKLLAGEGDVAAGGLTITQNRLNTVDFASPFASGIREAVVTGPASKTLNRLEELAGQELMVRASSSYFEHLNLLNKRFKEQGLAPIKVIAADENLEAEDLLEMVNAGLINATVVDRYLAERWLPLYTDLHIQDGFYLHQGAEFAWAIRKDSPLLNATLSAFFEQHKIGTAFGNSLRTKYVTHSKRMLNATSQQEMLKYQELVGLFEKHAGAYNFDALMLMAQGFQESQLDQRARSPRGAVGVMQLLPSTAADPSVAIKGIDNSADKNIEAGSKYMRLLADKYLNDPALTPINKTLMAFAAYNAGPGNLRKFRRLAEKSGLDPNVWFGNVEHAAARVVGRETVDYVGNIYKYYIAYKLVAERQQQKPPR